MPIGRSNAVARHEKAMQAFITPRDQSGNLSSFHFLETIESDGVVA